MEYVVIRIHSKIYKIRKSPYESDEKATYRAWYITTLPDTMSLCEKECRSQIWANEKYYGLKYTF
jgi:hypothetical protein